jgi:hypothetical protein
MNVLTGRRRLHQGVVFSTPITVFTKGHKARTDADPALNLAFALLPRKAYNKAIRPISQGWPVEVVEELGCDWQLIITTQEVWLVFAPKGGVTDQGVNRVADTAIDRTDEPLDELYRLFTVPWPDNRKALGETKLPPGFEDRYLRQGKR